MFMCTISGQTLVNNTPTQMCHSSSDSSDQEADVSADDHDNTILATYLPLRDQHTMNFFRPTLKKFKLPSESKTVFLFA